MFFNWFKNDAPDEYGDFNMLDLFRYMVKLRCYLISVNTVKYHLKKIYGKLGVKSALAAVWKAKVSGVI